MGAVNTSYEYLSPEQLEVLEADTLDQLRKLSAVGQSHSINGRSVSLPQLEALDTRLISIRRAIASQARARSIIASGGTFTGIHTTHAGFNRHF